MKYTFLFYSLLSTNLGFSQSLSPEIIASSGGFFDNGNSSLSWTIGETIIQTVSNASNILTQGFQQSNYIVTSIEEHSNKCLLKIYPNPAGDYFYINIESSNQTKLEFKIIDLKGHILCSDQFETNKQIDISNYENGIYYIQIFDGKNHSINSIKLQKLN